ncbi:type II toxin-antitoxin system HicB family antitoxin [Nocardiopsis flavescens]|uniref:Predicted nuclease of the RNAse H fold, HicB family n=1 Tax=Nocardiopsis flavescens TaxID=758803 RepID=A0A1M6FPF0_9ACTN|nr:toxin-antitoxin system HicB family antitoxin [Nocardiopsis flavescens]SHI99550.1 Predicted nuclease of the RNAse H fold, HicB family [Nocardiopsis flavescens]
MSRADHYAYRVRWSAEDESYLGTVAELPSLSWLADDRTAAFTGIQELAADVVEDMLASGEQPPEALADRSYSGKFMVRVPPEVHRRLNIEAAEQQVSLNRLVSARLSAATGTCTPPAA